MGIEKPEKNKIFKLDRGYFYEGKKNTESSDGVKKLSRDLVNPTESLKDKLLKHSEFKYTSIYDGLKFSKLIVYNSEDSLEQIKSDYFENKFDVIFLKNPQAAISDLSFIDFVIEKKIPFSSKIMKRHFESVSNAFLYISNKKALGRGGNKNAGLNVIEPANEFSKKIGPIIDELELEGHKSLQAKADELNARKIKTLRGKEWSSMTVKRTQDRWEKLKDDASDTKSKSPKPE